MAFTSNNDIDVVKMQERLIRLLREFAFEKNKYDHRVETFLKSTGRDMWMPKNGYLTHRQLLSLLDREGGPFFVQNDVVDLFRRLDNWGIVSDLQILDEPGPPLTLKDQAIKIYESTGVLENCVWGPSFIYAKYAKATPAITVEKNGSEHMGTGAIVRFGPRSENRFYLITNRHVADPETGYKIKNIEINNEKLEGFVGNWHFSSKDDLAAIALDATAVKTSFCIHYEVSPLQKVTTLGYPKIPFADDAYLAFHSGEINTVFPTTQGEEMFLISNQIGPGSSGGPVMDDKGLLVGIAAKAFQGRMEPDGDFTINWNTAVTFKRLRLFLEEVSGLQDWIDEAAAWAKQPTAPPPSSRTSGGL